MLSVLVHGYDNVGFDGWYQPVPHRPVDIITDVINDLGVRILQQYTDHGNVAFSPAGVGFVLAALYEGSTGRGRQQIADALGLPRDRDITRLGFRDIHRRLRVRMIPRRKLQNHGAIHRRQLSSDQKITHFLWTRSNGTTANLKPERAISLP